MQACSPREKIAVFSAVRQALDGRSAREMPMAHPAPSPMIGGPGILAIGAVAVGLAVFVLDSTTPVELSAGVFYVAVVLMVVRLLPPRGVVTVAVGCIALTLLSHYLSPGDPWGHTALINRFISIAATGVTTLIALKNQSVRTALQRAELDRVTRLITLGELAASIAHEVNQPLAGVVTSGDACLRWLGRQPPNVVSAKLSVERVIREGNRAGEILQRIRALVKGAPPHKELLNINETIWEVIGLVRGEIQRNQVLLRTRLSADLPPVPADRIQVQQVVLNLIVNAVEAMSNIDGPLRELLIVSEKDALNSVLIAVRDSGTGLDSGSLERVFDAFHTTKPNGMGMGLAICRSIIVAHGGKLWATNNVPNGAVFQFTLPVANG
jgi:signal transduction histidine kinase